MRGNSALDLRKDLADAFRSHFGSVGRGDEEQVFCGRGIGFFGSCAEAAFEQIGCNILEFPTFVIGEKFDFAGEIWRELDGGFHLRNLAGLLSTEDKGTGVSLLLMRNCKHPYRIPRSRPRVVWFCGGRPGRGW